MVKVIFDSITCRQLKIEISNSTQCTWMLYHSIYLMVTGEMHVQRTYSNVCLYTKKDGHIISWYVPDAFGHADRLFYAQYDYLSVVL